ncbi:YggT family protein [Agathobaculum sp. NSJ-28]|uniref:YggT family protein n=2 Tax=Butyricicoccaceae TaxID=3085642 RepID=A0A923RUM6_9FIRM|nr:YggT family protein [Agathobaculum faecis]MBS6882033.1 YggT family protein [Clostridiaceae bacterium]
MINLFILNFVTSIVRCLEFLLFARAIMSWFAQGRDSKIYEFLYTVTEPLVLPFRHLLDGVRSLRNVPIDIAFLLAFFTLELVLMLLYSL